MDERQIESRSSRQWEAIVKLRIRQGESGTTVLRYLVEKELLQDQARQIVENAIRSARPGSLILVTIGSVAVLLGIVVTVASYLAAASSPFGGTYHIWWGPVVCGLVALLVGVVRLSRIHS